MTATSPAPTKAALITGFITIYLLWGSTYLGIKIAVETIPPFLMASSRFILAGGILATWIAVTRGFRATRRQWFDNAIVGALLLLGGNGLVAWSEQKIPSGIATLIVSLGPVFIVLLDWAVHAASKDRRLGTKPNWITFLGLGLGIAGLALLVGPSLGSGASQLDVWSVAALVFACFSWSVGSIYTRYVRAPAELFTAAAMQMLTGSAWLLLVAFLRGEVTHFDYTAVSTRSFYSWIYLVIAGSLVGFTTFVWLMKHSTPARVSTYAYVNPIVAVFLGWLIAGEPVGPRMFVAAAIIIAGVAIITAAKSRKPVVTPSADEPGVPPSKLVPEKR